MKIILVLATIFWLMIGLSTYSKYEKREEEKMRLEQIIHGD